MFLPSTLNRGSYLPGPHDVYTARCAAVGAGESAMIAPTFRSRLGHPSRRFPMPGANELSTVEWQIAQVIPSLVTPVPAALGVALMPMTALRPRSATVVFGSVRLMVLFWMP